MDSLPRGLLSVTPANPSGRTQLDGTTEITDLDKTEENKAIIRGFITDVLLNGKGDHVAYYDLFRLADGKIVEHWDVIETIPTKENWKNTNGKF